MRDGLWDNNVVLAQMLALCPTMAVTTSGSNGLGMGLATTAVLVAANVVVSLLRPLIAAQVRLPVFVVVIALLVSVVDLAMNAWWHELHKVLGLFIALIVVNCAILGRAEAFASRHGVLASAVDGVATGLGFTLVLTVIGLLRELLGAGTLFAGAALLLGPAFAFLELRVLPADSGALLMILPPGGFLTVGLLIAAKRRLERRAGGATAAAAAALAEGGSR